VREWGLLTAWQRGFTRPITYADLAMKWAPGNRSYVGMLQTVAERFHADVCRSPDPRPHLVQEARALIAGATSDSAPAAEASSGPPSVLALGKELMQRVFDPKTDPNQGRSALGAPPPAAEPAPPAAQAVPYKVLNAAPPAEAPPTSVSSAAPAVSTPAASATPVKTATSDAGAAPTRSVVADTGISAGISTGLGTGHKAPEAGASAPPVASAKVGIGDKASARFALAGAAATAAPKTRPLPDTAVPPAANQKCRVWTASYGGQKSIIIRSVVDQVVNFTVLDVNSGQEVREAEAFIAAYAKNGKIAGEYTNQAQALDKAFELCPEG
jgi:hypothetical protein